jgi:hypothetical protein
MPKALKCPGIDRAIYGHQFWHTGHPRATYGPVLLTTLWSTSGCFVKNACKGKGRNCRPEFSLGRVAARGRKIRRVDRQDWVVLGMGS